MNAEAERRWRSYCHRMAEATHAIADLCEDPEMISAYVVLAAKWLRMAEAQPPGRAPDDLPDI